MKLLFLRADDDNIFKAYQYLRTASNQNDERYNLSREEGAHLYDGDFLFRTLFHILLTLYEYSRPLLFSYVHVHSLFFARGLLGNKNMSK